MPINVVAKSRLRPFWKKYPSAEGPLTAWYTACSHAKWTCFADIKKTYGSADMAWEFVVFDVGAYRVITSMSYATAHLFIKSVLTHTEYDKWTQSMRSKKGA